ncbi:MAG: sulfatase-like hydrolase/transferase [Anaerolineales bacterium]|nr:sulfatase-like hydrolase/transferase [Anaerolineales bacterium]
MRYGLIHPISKRTGKPREQISRRDFLKTFSVIPVAAIGRFLQNSTGTPFQLPPPNVIVLVFDAWSANHLRMHGYQRDTMPNLEKFADRATVYHRHYSSAPFTTPGTASLISGLHPWTHRALLLGGIMRAKHSDHNLFSALSSTHSTLAYTQNINADQLIFQAEKAIGRHIPTESLNLKGSVLYNKSFFRKDSHIAFESFEDYIFQDGIGDDGSLFFGPLVRLGNLREDLLEQIQYSREYPRGLPRAEMLGYYRIEQVADGVIDILKSIQTPTAAYVYVYPPHGPYNPPGEFVGNFNDGFKSPEKPIHPLSVGHESYRDLLKKRKKYDELLSGWDAEVGRIFTFMKEAGLFENSIVVVTSDHGEMFERGEVGHFTPLLYDPVVHIPLLISMPGQTERRDVRSLTSSIDLVPTLAHLTGNSRPDWVEGRILPGIGSNDNLDESSVYTMDAQKSAVFGDLSQFSISLRKYNYHLIYYHYPQYTGFELYDLNEDPEEMQDLFPIMPTDARELLDELKQQILKKLNSKVTFRN